jgi:hypothetical protein
MTNSRILRKFSGSAYFFALGAALAGCSSSEGEPEGSGGSASTAGSSNANAGSSNNTSGSSGSGNSSGAGTGGTSSSSKDLVGSFQVLITVDDEDPTKGATSVIGKVNDGASPPTLSWSVIKEEGDCRVEKPSVPFCDPACGAEVCVAEDKCVPYPAGQSVGDVTIDGLMVEGSGTSLMLKEIAKAYQPPANTTFAWPPFAEGDDVTVKAAGGSFSAFELKAKGVKPLIVTATEFEVAEGKPLELTWEAATDPKASKVHLKLDISHHGGTRGMIQCDTDDSGSLTIPAELMTELIGLGVAGFPTFVLTRSTRATAQIAPGVVELEVSAKVEQAVTVEGVVSCTEDTDCPDGASCQDDLTCE